MPEEKKDVQDNKDVKIEELGEEDLDNVVIDDDDKITIKDPETNEKSASDDEIPDKDDEDDEDETSSAPDDKDDGTPGEKKDEDDDSEASDDKDDEIPSEKKFDEYEKEELDQLKKDDPLKYRELKADKRVADAQRKMHEATQKAKEEEKKRLEVEKKLLEDRKPKEPKQYSEDELEEMKFDEPEKWRQVMNEREQYETRKTEYEADEKAFKETEVTTQQRERFEGQLTEMLDFTETVLKIKVDRTLPLDDQTQDVKDFIDGPFKKVDEYLKDKQHLRDVKTGLFSKDTMRMVYRDLNFDQLKSTSKKEGREQAVNDIGKASKGGSNLDKGPHGHEKGTHRKELEDLSQDEIDHMGEEELKSWDDEINE